MTGDMHGHHRNFDKLVKYCRLDRTPTRHVILHELIHEQPQGFDSVDRSGELMLDAAKWKTEYPEQIHFLQSNHELAQLQDHEITKGGRMVTEDFERGIALTMGTSEIDAVLDEIDRVIASYPVAMRTPNRIFCSHSLPNVTHMEEFEPECVHQPAESLDLTEGGMIYQMVWGRRHTPALLDRLAMAYDVDVFLTGHQPQEFGHEARFERLIILASDNNHGVFLPFDCRKPIGLKELVERIRPYNGVL